MAESAPRDDRDVLRCVAFGEKRMDRGGRLLEKAGFVGVFVQLRVEAMHYAAGLHRLVGQLQRVGERDHDVGRAVVHRRAEHGPVGQRDGFAPVEIL